MWNIKKAKIDIGKIAHLVRSSLIVEIQSCLFSRASSPLHPICRSLSPILNQRSLPPIRNQRSENVSPMSDMSELQNSNIMVRNDFSQTCSKIFILFIYNNGLYQNNQKMIDLYHHFIWIKKNIIPVQLWPFWRLSFQALISN